MSKCPLVWTDLETTGIPVSGHILEVACLITDSDLNLIAEYSTIVTHANHDDPKHSLDTLGEFMNDYVTNMHTKNGLLQEIADCQDKIVLTDVDAALAEFIAEYSPDAKSPLCGSTINFDRKWMDAQMLLASKALHYHNVDVSTVRELAQRWRKDIETPGRSKPNKKHRGLSDIKESLDLLRFYRGNFFHLQSIDEQRLAIEQEHLAIDKEHLAIRHEMLKRRVERDERNEARAARKDERSARAEKRAIEHARLFKGVAGNQQSITDAIAPDTPEPPERPDAPVLTLATNSVPKKRIREVSVSVILGREIVTSYSFTQDVIRVGKLQSSQITLDGDLKVARMHAVIEVKASGLLKIIDLGSLHGTILNGEKIDKDADLVERDRLGFGDFEVIIDKIDYEEDKFAD